MDLAPDNRGPCDIFRDAGGAEDEIQQPGISRITANFAIGPAGKGILMHDPRNRMVPPGHLEHPPLERIQSSFELMQSRSEPAHGEGRGMGCEQILYFVKEEKPVVAGASAVGRGGERHIHSKFPNHVWPASPQANARRYDVSVESASAAQGDSLSLSAAFGWLM